MIVEGVSAATPVKKRPLPAIEIGTLKPPVTGAAITPATPTY
jgi:hypothetical protein